MTFIDYVGVLLVGSGARPSTNADEDITRSSQGEENGIARAETEVVTIASQLAVPASQRESKENTAGMTLALGTMVANYALCYPIVVTRHQLQAFPVAQSWQRDTPSHCVSMLRQTYRAGGVRALYAGFELGLLSQLISAAYEALLGEVMHSLRRAAPPMRSVVLGLGKCMTLAILIPLYPLNRNALVLRVQSPHQPRITGFRQFMQCYLRDLRRFLPSGARETWPGALPLSSIFLPSCIVNTLSERTHLYLYRRIYYATTTDPFHKKKLRRRSSRRNDPRKHLTMLHTYYPEITCGVISSLITRALSYPVDTVLFKLMMQDSQLQVAQHPLYTGFWHCVRCTWREGGVSAFFPGWGAGILEAGLAYAILEYSWCAYQAVNYSFERSLDSRKKPLHSE